MTRDGAIARLPAATIPTETKSPPGRGSGQEQRWLLIGLLVLLPSASTASELHEGVWRAWLDSPGGELPFQLEIRRSDETHSAWIGTAAERYAVPNVHVAGDGIELGFPHFDASIVATPSRNGLRLDGVWTRHMGDVVEITMPFHARAGLAPEEPRGDDVLFPERWRVQFENLSYPSVGLLRRGNDGELLGVFLRTTGDSRILTGWVREDHLRLSYFDGGQPILAVAEIQADGTLVGTFWYGTRVLEDWTAWPDPDASTPDPFTLLQLDDSLDLDAIVAYDLEGTPCSLAEALPPGRAWIIEILGTWCPNCHEASQFLTQLQEEYAERGLGVLGLAFQMSSNLERNASDVRRYERRNGVEYPVLLASNDTPVSPSLLFPNTMGEFAFPTVLFVDGNRRVRATYTGFSGPATEAEHESLKRRWRNVVEEMLGDGK